jgi:hypothetical protein
MTRFRFDQFSRQYLEELLKPFGEVSVGKEVLGESREVDVWFTPNPQGQENTQAVDLLGRLAATPCLFEPYSDQPTSTQVRDCLLKLFLTQARVHRESKRNKTRSEEEDLPQLWILATSASKKLLSGFRAKQDAAWPTGIYFLGDSLRTAIIAINQLPCTPDTLWLRVLGKGATREQAVSELLAMSREVGLRNLTLRLLMNWRIEINLNIDDNELDEETRELIMQLSPAYIKWREETLQEGEAKGKAEGKVEGKAEGKAEVAINLLRSGMDSEQVVQLTGLSMELVLQLARESGEATD